MPHRERTVGAVLAAAILVSIVHYVDNVAAYDAYPEPETLPNPSAALIAASWFGFTALAIAALALLRRGRERAAAFCLAGYSGSGLVGILHYGVGGTGDFPWWRHAHIVADIGLGAVVLLLAVRTALRARPGGPAAHTG